MKTLRFAIAAVASLALGTAAHAADYPVKAPHPVFAAWNWTGFYAGLHAGYGWLRLTGESPGGSETRSATGGLAGGQVGFNYQFASRWVVGAEVDMSFAEVKDTLMRADPLVPNALLADESKLSHFGTARVRVGHAFDRFLVYGTGGLAWGQANVRFGQPGNGAPGATAIIESEGHTHTGWAAGAGVEGVLSGNWTAKLEYLSARLGSETYTIGGARIKLDVQTLKVGVNYLFR